MKTGLILGSQGMLGSNLKRIFLENGYRVLAPTHKQLDVTNSDQIVSFFREHKPNWVVNCSAKHNLASCQKEFDDAMKLNCHAVGFLAEIAKSYSAYLIHISTDYVFDGQKGSPYIEEDEPNPVNFYGVSKFQGERMVLENCNTACIVRVAALFGAGISRDKGSVSFVDRMRSKLLEGETVTVTSEQIVSPTSTNEVAQQFLRLIEEKPNGILHCVNGGFTSWYHLTKFIAQQLGIGCNKVLRLGTESENIDGIDRPKNSSLENFRLNELNLNKMQSWENAISDYLKS